MDSGVYILSFPPPPRGGNFIKLLGCWGRKSSGEDWTKEEGKGNYEIIALKMQELCLNFPKKNSGKGVTPLSTPKKDKNRFALFFPWGRKSSWKYRGGEIFQVGGKNIHPCNSFWQFRRCISRKIWPTDFDFSSSSLSVHWIICIIICVINIRHCFRRYPIASTMTRILRRRNYIPRQSQVSRCRRHKITNKNYATLTNVDFGSSSCGFTERPSDCSESRRYN